MRNIVDDVAVNIRFDMYSPLIHQVQLIKLEKWSDTNLDYLRKYADAEYCRIPFDMMPEVVPPLNIPIDVFDAKGNESKIYQKKLFELLEPIFDSLFNSNDETTRARCHSGHIH